MRKIIIFFVATLFILGSVSAQGFGVKGGVNLGKFVGEDVKDISDELDEKYNFGYGGGIFLSLPIDPLEIRLEALYQQNGAVFEGEEEGAKASLSTQLNWVDIPVLVGVKAGPVRVFAGPYFDFFLGGKMKIELSYGGQSFDEEEDIEADELQSFNYGIIGGVAFGMGAMELEVRYSQGLNSLDKEPDDWDSTYGEYEETDFKPSMIQAFLNFYLSQ
jgi:hypothetical protein